MPFWNNLTQKSDHNIDNSLVFSDLISKYFNSPWMSWELEFAFYKQKAIMALYQYTCIAQWDLSFTSDHFYTSKLFIKLELVVGFVLRSVLSCCFCRFKSFDQHWIDRSVYLILEYISILISWAQCNFNFISLQKEYKNINLEANLK